MKKILILAFLFFIALCIYSIKLNYSEGDVASSNYQSTFDDNDESRYEGYTEKIVEAASSAQSALPVIDVSSVEQDKPVKQSEVSDLEAFLSPDGEQLTPYQYMSLSFANQPKETKFKDMFEDVLKKYYLEQTDEQRTKVGGMLLFLRQQSKTGVTELDILKDVYQNGDPNLSIGQQAEISAKKLEKENKQHWEQPVLASN